MPGTYTIGYNECHTHITGNHCKSSILARLDGIKPGLEAAAIDTYIYNSQLVANYSTAKPDIQLVLSSKKKQQTALPQKTIAHVVFYNNRVKSAIQSMWSKIYSQATLCS